MKQSVLSKSGRAQLATEIVGRGAPIVFLHARVADRRMWQHQMQVLGERHQAIAYDRRGFGETVAAAEDHSATEDLLAVLDSVADGAPAMLVASSQGGGIAIDAALRYPSSVCALVLIASSVSGAPPLIHAAPTGELLTRLAQAEASQDVQTALAIRTQLWLDGPLQHEGRVTGEARVRFEAMNRDALGLPFAGTNRDMQTAYGRLGEVAVPTLVLCGDLDLAGIQGRSRDIASKVRGAKWVSIADAAHLPSLERPDRVSRLIADFVEAQ